MQFLIAIALGLLAGCSFHVRGSGELPPSLKPLYVDGFANTHPIVRYLESTLSSQEAYAADRASARMILALKNENWQRRILAVGNDGRPQEFELKYSLRYALQREDDVPVIPDTNITFSREYSYSAAQALSKSLEEDVLREEIYRDVASAILQRLKYAPLPIAENGAIK